MSLWIKKTGKRKCDKIIQDCLGYLGLFFNAKIYDEASQVFTQSFKSIFFQIPDFEVKVVFEC